MASVFFLTVWLVFTQPNGQIAAAVGHDMFPDKASCEAKAKEFLKEQPQAQWSCTKSPVMGKQV